MGLLGAAAAAGHDGFGGGAVDLMGVMEAFGEALVVEPSSRPCSARGSWRAPGSEAQQAAMLPAVAEGSAASSPLRTPRRARATTSRMSRRGRAARARTT